MQFLTCNLCKRTLDATKKNFAWTKKYGLLRRCRACHNRIVLRSYRQCCDKKPYYYRARLMFRAIHRRARQKGIDVSIGCEWLEKQLWYQRGRCLCCNKLLRIQPGGGRVNPISPTVDRLDPAGSYEPSNCRIICWRCNSIKRDASAEELRIIARYVECQGNH